jgi:hypothetical protein
MPTYSDLVNTIHVCAVFTLLLGDLRVLTATARLDIVLGVQAFPWDRSTSGEGCHVGRVTRLQTRGTKGFTESGLLGERSSSARGDARDALLIGGDAKRGATEGEAGVASYEHKV